MKGIADTGFLVAFANRYDQHHEWAVGIASRVIAAGAGLDLKDPATRARIVDHVATTVRRALAA